MMLHCHKQMAQQWIHADQPLSTAAQNDLDFDADADVRTVLVVHDTMPPFLDGRVRFTKQADLVLPLRDPTSDMAVISRNGSQLVRAPCFALPSFPDN
jgi:hypothetical protein